ncbi:hypothetical protein HMPREF1624_06125 [Sporothrix schenckii ATCC 58251]|uniref:Karyogamy protein n=1 Tax=Sporothrix schenckii (strain ATCC 58251 / de Perez 2211183) TaxID=1391915 RepID=U7PQP6_SPOS1|nr:hypothetical protein HMPREF1624_06125 [Sporothrix schenckii ATCC 58251]
MTTTFVASAPGVPVGDVYEYGPSCSTVPFQHPASRPADAATSAASVPFVTAVPSSNSLPATLGEGGHLHLQTDNPSQSQSQRPSSAFPVLAQTLSDRHNRSSSSSSSTCDGGATSSVLTFAEIPSDLARLNFNHQRMPDTDTHVVAPVDLAASSTPLKPHIPPETQSPASLAQPTLLTPSSSPLRPARRVGFAATPTEDLSPNSANRAGDFPESSRPRVSSTASSASSTTPVQHPQPRKPSPGLAARLKALGFGTTTRKNSQPPGPASSNHPERIGRLPEDQIRQIDQNHQAGSSQLVIERRGRPWKGAGAAVARLPASVANLATGHGKQKPDADDADPYFDSTTTSATAIVVVTEPDGSNADTASHSPASSFLPEIAPTQPLDMDTNKYRLPDHTNGNGTKVQLDTRQQHIERDSTANPSSNASVRIASPDIPPPLPAKDTPPLTQQQQQQQAAAPETPSQSDFNPDATSYFNPLGLQRPGSIYTLSRVSFANQLAQLTSLQLPDAESLSSKVSAIPTAQAASRALIGAAEQIRNWISKASEVIEGLDSDDDVEWAAAGGREGLEEVENAILRFEELINVYVGAIESLQCRPDIANVTRDELQRAVYQMESIMEEWGRMRSALQSVKAQVEIAMEWEELWSMVLGDIQNEMEELSRLVFEMEERRHRSLAEGGGVDIGDLETIVEETQNKQQLSPNVALSRTSSANNRNSLSIFPLTPASPEAQSTTPTISQDDSSLLALFARMQPLRASLDFLPMRLSVFETRASSCFPTACEELEMRRAGLDGTYKKLEKDAESLRKELGEDRWVTVFRGAARQAQKMYESVERSVARLKEALDMGLHLTNQPVMVKKIESYETKKTHYGPAIERVLAIIDKGVKDRLTLNGEILRLHVELQSQWDELRDQMHEINVAIEELHSDEQRNQQLRDSISSMLSNDRSTIGSGRDTPQSSPPSSVIMSTLGLDNSSSKRLAAKLADVNGTPTNNRRRSNLGGTHLPQPAARRSVSSSVTLGAAQARKPLSRFSSSFGPGGGSSVSSPGREGSVTPVSKRVSGQPPRAPSILDNRPRWNTSTTGIDTGHNFKPMSLTTPSPYAKTPPSATRRSVTGTPRSTSSLSSRLPMRSPLSRGVSSPAAQADGSPSHDPPGFRDAPPYRPPRLAAHSSAPPATSNRRASMQPPSVHQPSSPNVTPQRPASSMAASRRNSLLPAPRPREGTVSGRESPQAVAGARFAMRKKPVEPKPNGKPKWRP